MLQGPFNSNAPKEYPDTVSVVIDRFQNVGQVLNEYYTAVSDDNGASYVREMAKASYAMRVLKVMNDLAFYKQTRGTDIPRDYGQCYTMVEDAVHDPEFKKLAGVHPSSDNAAHAAAVCHMAQVYDSIISYNIILDMEMPPIWEREDDSSAFRKEAVRCLQHVCEKLKLMGRESEVADIQSVITYEQDLLKSLPYSNVHLRAVANRINDFFGQPAYDPTASSIRLNQVLEQRVSQMLGQPSGNASEATNMNLKP